MQEVFLEKLWGKPISIPVSFLIFALLVISAFPEKDEKYTVFILTAIVCFILFVIYTIQVIRQNALPHCKKNEVGVLFVFKVGSEGQYKDFKFEVEENFKKNVEMCTTKIVPICINASSLKDYDLSNSRSMTKLLNKTNCYFCVELFVESDSLNNPNKYVTSINAGVLSPNVSQNAVEFLLNGLSYGTKPIRKIKFDSKDKIDTLKDATSYLTILSEYTISILLIMCNKSSEALSILTSLYFTMARNHVLYKIISEAVHEAIWHILPSIYDKYYRTDDKTYLEQIEYYTKLAYSAIPKPYDYNLNMAQLVFLKNRDIALARKHINKCKNINSNDYWKYSDAFLLTYENDNPNIVFSKYKQLKDNSYNIVNIIHFIEKVLEEEPNNHLLHLALGVLYDNNNDYILASCHFKKFIDNYNGKISLRKNILQKIKSKIDLDVCEENKKLNLCDKCLF